jgi:hypothetical protein
MATTNPSLTSAWGKIVDAGDEFFLSLPFSTRLDIEVATAGPVDEPTVRGHVLRGDRNESVNRALLGAGSVYARAIGANALTVVLSTWNNDPILFGASTWDTSATWLTNYTWG